MSSPKDSNQPPPRGLPKVLIVAGEASGDMHGANLLRAMLAIRPELEVSAMGGSALKTAGAHLLYDSSRLAVVGVIEVLGHLGEILVARRLLVDFLKKQRPQLLILIDYPDFNLWLAASAKKLGIPVFYYISPQVWAWRQGRVSRIERLVNKMAVILPFERDFYRSRGVEVDFVGHPLVDELAGMERDRCGRGGEVKESGCGHSPPRIGIVPGSRRREIALMLPVFLEAAHIMAAKRSRPPVFILPLAPGLKEETLIEHGLNNYPELDIRVSVRDRHRNMADCDAVMAASGTVTLELAILDVPMVTAYRVSPVTYALGRMLVKVPFTNLVNLVAGREVVPELIQKMAEPGRIAHELEQILDLPQRRRQMLEGLAEVREKLGGAGASQRAAHAALELLPR